MADIKRWEPFKDISSIQREMDDLFRRFFGSFTPSFFRREFRAEWYPLIDAYMKDGEFVIHADLPGIDPKDVDISVTGNVLLIRGERKTGFEEKKGGYMVHEATYGNFERAFTLPEGVDTNKVKAVYKNGVLELAMPAKAEALPRKVKVEIEGKEEKKAA